jgi:hypothetical protein
VDTHEVFQRQWCKRKAYYKKQQYKIVGTDSVAYPPTKWKPMFEPCNNNSSKKEDELLEEDDLDLEEDLDEDGCLAGGQSVTTKNVTTTSVTTKSKETSMFGGKCLLKIKR